ncbi:MAG: response regulator [Desulfobacterales bacterium]|nr:response regulator [Desulfobacterales bacterium]
MSEKIKVLMVDDEAQFRRTTDKILSRRGFDTLMAESGEEALGRLAENPDVVILDIRMEGIDGHETLRAIKEQKPDLPVIMLTGHGDLPSAREAYDEGAFDYLAKPCDIDVLTGKIRDAYHKGKSPKEYTEKSVLDVMVPIHEYTTLHGHATVKDAIDALKQSFVSKLSTSRIMETGHRSVLVLDDQNRVKGVVAILDLLKMILPAYLFTPKPSLADSIQYSPLFWNGMFSTETQRIAEKKIQDIMSPAPYAIDGSASLMEATYRMVRYQVRRLVVIEKGGVIGVIREQDLFFEMEKFLNGVSP